MVLITYTFKVIIITDIDTDPFESWGPEKDGLWSCKK